MRIKEGIYSFKLRSKAMGQESIINPTVIYDNDELKRMSDRNLEKIKKYTIEEMVNNHINIFNTF